MEVKMKEFNSLVNRIDSAYHDGSVRLGVSDSEMIIFYGIMVHGEGCNQSVLYKDSGLSKSTLNSAIRKMEKEELLYLKPGEGRNTRVFLTEKGRQKAENTIARIIEIENEIYASWSEDEWDLFMKLNERFYEQLQEKVKNL